MKFKLNNEIFNVESKDNNYIINDIPFEIDLNRLSLHQYKTRYFDKTYDIFVAQDKNMLYANVNGDYYELKKADDDDLDEYTAESSDTEIIRSQMPGSVIDVLVKPGDDVKEGQPVIIIEAMKMESTMYSSIDGVVEQVNCKKDTQIDADVELVVIKKVSE